MTVKRTIIIFLAFIICAMSSCSFVSLGGDSQKLTPGKDDKNSFADIAEPGASLELLSVLAREDDGERKPTEEFLKAITNSSFEYFSAAIEDGKTSGNILISPLSIYIALAMTACGAEGETLSQMEGVLGNISPEDAARYLSYLEESLSESHRIELEIANSIWIRDNKNMIKANPDFIEVLDEYFDADAYLAAFDKGTLKDINDWISDNTNGMIRNMLDDIPELAVMYLINALVFEADWAETYDKVQLEMGEFTEYDGSKKNTELMWSSEDVYIKDDGAIGFIKPYADRRFGFVTLLPDESTDIYEYAASLTGERFAAILESSEKAIVEAVMPQFKYEYKDSLVNEFTAMGMTDAFSEDLADFRGMGKSGSYGNIFISDILHKTFIEVSPKGTKAGAATVVEMMAEGISLPTNLNRYEVHLDRPFVYAICDLESGTPLFVGVLTALN